MPGEQEKTPVPKFVPYVVIADGPHTGNKFQLREGDNSIGRSAAGVVMLEDQSVSRQHAVLSRTKEGWVVKDVGSKNGTFVNGQKIKTAVNIGHGDIIKVGIYSLRLISHQVNVEEELAPLPPALEGKTVMVSKKEALGETTQATAELPPEETPGEESEAPTGPQEIGEKEAPISEPQELPEKERSPYIKYGAMALALIAVASVGGYLYWKFLGESSKPLPAVVKPVETEPLAPTLPSAPPPPKNIPVFLDFASSPLPARVTMEGKDYGLTPTKINKELEIGKTYSAEASFQLDELQDVRNISVTFTVEKDSNLIPILFKAPIGILKVSNLPRDTQLYIEGYYGEDQFKPHTAKIAEVVFGKPVYVPYGKFMIELRQPKQIGETNQFIEDIRYRREFKISEDSPVFEINVFDEDLQKFPVEVRSIPTKADVFMDAQFVGQTPFTGLFPLGEHTLTLRKDGYFEQTQELKTDINTPYQTEITLKTTKAGEFINAGNALLIKGLYQDAITQFSEVFKNVPTPSEIAQTQYLLGSAYLKLNDSATALGYFEQARQHENFRYQAMLGVVSIYALQKQTALALPLLVEVLLKAQDEEVKKDATALFRQVSPLRSVMYIYSDPTGAEVSVNDKVMEQKTPLILHDLGLGNYKIRIKKDGYVPQDLNINMSVSEFNPIIIKLKPVE